MPLLDLKEAGVHVQASTVSSKKTVLSVGLSQSEANDLASCLEEIYSSEGQELRLALSEEWTLFWKRREDGSRSLVAHPQAEEWVGTVALEQGFGEKLILALKELEVRREFALNQLGGLNSVSNLELTFRLRV